jgi:phosphoglycerol transferase MdoB-like AlkP superfamily enzyme
MKAYGNEQNITPFLDSLATKFTLLLIFYASGNRTVRGLEAVTLCFPPTAGESIVKEKTIKQIFNGSVLRQRIQCKSIYGGDAF